MKKNVITLFLCGISLIAQAQNSSVEKSIFGVQIGLLGVWVHNEAKLTEKIVLRSELGLDSGLFSKSYYEDDIGFFMTPVITLEPRFYYNLNKRVAKSKNISGNSGNYLSLKTSYNPNWFVISSDDIIVTDQISMVPTWGIRRNIGKHFTYETGIGIGYRYTFAKQAGFLKNESETTANLHLRIGYRF